MTRKNALMIWAGAFLVVIGCALLFYLGPYRWLSEENRRGNADIAANHVSGPKTVARTRNPKEGAQQEKKRVALYPARKAGDDQGRKSGIQKPDDTFAPSQPSQVIKESGAESQTLRKESQRPARSRAEEPESREISKIAAIISPRPVGAQAARVDHPLIRRSAIALGVENREPTGVCQRVSVRQGRVYCWMHVIDSQGGEVTVRWIGKGRRIADVHLPVGSNSWRTWAYISLKPGMIGPAQVDILDENGELLKTLSFEITE